MRDVAKEKETKGTETDKERKFQSPKDAKEESKKNRKEENKEKSKFTATRATHVRQSKLNVMQTKHRELENLKMLKHIGALSRMSSRTCSTFGSVVSGKPLSSISSRIFRCGKKERK